MPPADCLFIGQFLGRWREHTSVPEHPAEHRMPLTPGLGPKTPAHPPPPQGLSTAPRSPPTTCVSAHETSPTDRAMALKTGQRHPPGDAP